jgi:hypothetical protein
MRSTAVTYRLIVSDTHRTKVWKTGLTLQQAEKLKDQAAWDPRTWFLIVTIEQEALAEPAGAVSATRSAATGPPAPAPTATAKPARKPCRPFDALDQERRIAAAIIQAGDYTFTAHDPGTWICDGPRGSFLVTEDGECSCEDAAYTTGPVNGRCKHAILLGHRLIEMGAGMTGTPLYPLSPADLAKPARITREVACA